jgi:hypothetical protein
MIDFLNEQWQLATFLFVILFLGNSYLSRLSNKFYEIHARQYINFENDSESIYNNQKEVKQNRLLTSQNLYPVLITAMLIASRLLYGKQFFEFLYGAVFLVTIYFVIKHTENILQFSAMSKPNSIIGKIEYSRPLTRRIVFLGLFGQAAILGIVAFSTMRPFFWGGTLYCLWLGFQKMSDARKPLLLK